VDEPGPVIEEEEIQYEVTVVVYTVSREEYKVPLGLASQSQVPGIHDQIRSSFYTLAPSKALTFVDKDGVTRHFNAANVTCVEVKIS
jgi:hypothetical protein